MTFKNDQSRLIRLVTGSCIAAISLNLCGCVHRRMTIHSNPPGAQVWIDGEKTGYTPTSVDFTYYGTREIKLMKDGYKTMTVLQKVTTPWYQLVPLDAISDNLLPFQVTNRHKFTYQLEKSLLVSESKLRERADQFRTNAQLGR